MSLDDQDLMRYGRQIMLQQIDVSGQLAIKQSTIAVIGLGGLGCPAAMYLASSGVGRLILVDGDHVESSNLHRQILHREASIGLNKAVSASRSLAEIAPSSPTTVIESYVDDELISKICAQADVVLDCTDNFAARYRINSACVKHQIPLVSGAAIRFEGHVTVIDSRQEQAPCYQCLYPDVDAEDDARCVTNGVLPPIVGMVGSMQALEALKLVTNVGQTASGKLMICDGLYAQWRVVKYLKRESCPVCGSQR